MAVIFLFLGFRKLNPFLYYVILGLTNNITLPIYVLWLHLQMLKDGTIILNRKYLQNMVRF